MQVRHLGRAALHWGGGFGVLVTYGSKRNFFSFARHCDVMSRDYLPWTFFCDMQGTDCQLGLLISGCLAAIQGD